MTTRFALGFAAALALSGCGSKMIDPCAGETGACVAVQIDRSASVTRLDSATIHVVGGGLDEEKSTTLARGGSFALPVAIALVFDNITDATPVPLTIAVNGLLGGNLVAGGGGQVSVAAHQHATLQVELTTDGIAPPDLATADDVDMGDGGGADLAVCPQGHHECGGQCVADTSTDSCGATSCTTCPVTANATAATCDGTSCGLTCATGYHLCGGACVSSTSVDSCNLSCTSCTPPTGGNATCDGTSCGGACPSNQKLCAGVCIPSAMACNGMCTSGSHDCSGNCFANDSVNSCGSSCTPCPVPANAMNATCVSSTSCDFVCNANYKKCGAACIPSTGCCTTADCAQPSNGSATCNTTTNMCVPMCNSSYTDCNGSCKPITSVNSCGASCTVCSAPANATPTCNGTSCDFVCNGNYLRSGNSCVACGGAGQICCASNTCSKPYACSSGSCQQKSLTWTNVASGTTEALDALWVDSLGRAYAGGTKAKVPYCPSSSGCALGTLPNGASDIGGVWGLGTTVYSSDSAGIVYSSSNLGAWQTFTPTPSPEPGVYLGPIAGDSKGNLFFADGHAGILAYKASSTSWSTIPQSSTQMQSIAGLWLGGPTQSDLYAVGQNPGVVSHASVARSHDGGATWKNLSAPGMLAAFWGVWGSASGNVYIVGAVGTVQKLTLASDVFTLEVASDANGQNLSAVWGSDTSGYYYAVGDGGTILHSIGDGIWHAETSPTTQKLNAVFGSPDGSVVWAVGEAGTIIRGQ